MKIFTFQVTAYGGSVENRKVRAANYEAALNLLYFSPGSQVASANLLGTANGRGN